LYSGSIGWQPETKPLRGAVVQSLKVRQRRARCSAPVESTSRGRLGYDSIIGPSPTHIACGLFLPAATVGFWLLAMVAVRALLVAFLGWYLLGVLR
jgi:hypothetical protein